jgi:hypothetical protein
MGVLPRMNRPFLALPMGLCAALLGVVGCSGGGAAATTASTATTTIPATTTTLPLLVDGYMSGFGFYLGSADQTAGLFVEFTDTRAAAEGNIPDVSTLPDGRWDAEVRIGSDLFAFLVGSTSGSPRVDEAWPVVAGSITILELPSPGECGVAKAHLEGFQAEAPDGTLVDLSDFEVENSQWGCFMM